MGGVLDTEGRRSRVVVLYCFRDDHRLVHLPFLAPVKEDGDGWSCKIVLFICLMSFFSFVRISYFASKFILILCLSYEKYKQQIEFIEYEKFTL